MAISGRNSFGGALMLKKVPVCEYFESYLAKALARDEFEGVIRKDTKCIFYNKTIGGDIEQITKTLPTLVRLHYKYQWERRYCLGLIFDTKGEIGRVIDLNELEKEINLLPKNEKEKALNSPVLETIQKQYRELIKYIQSGEIHPKLGISLDNPELVSYLNEGRLVFPN